MADITGIDLAGIDKIQSKITAWVKEINSIDTVATAKQVANAVKGTKREGEIKALCQSMTSYVNTLTKQLTDYNNRLTQVKTNYKSNDATASAALSNATSQVKSMKS